jgi:L-ascorbate metabolism protein UlaG (beta-lactamase superfamily)
MKRNVFIFGIMLLSAIWILTPMTMVFGACRNPNVAQSDHPWFRRAAASGFIEIEWFGHSFFRITSSSGTRIITDPFGYMGFPVPEVAPHVVTVGKETRNHSNVALAKGNPLILRGQKPGGTEWNHVNTFFRDVLIYNVPINVRAPYDFLKGSAFVFELDGLCIGHSGDVGDVYNKEQFALLGHIDVLLMTIGGTYSAGPKEAKQIIAQLKPKIVVPMHYWYRNDNLEQFLDGPHPARFFESNKFVVNKDTLPSLTEIYVLKVVRETDL